MRSNTASHLKVEAVVDVIVAGHLCEEYTQIVICSQLGASGKMTPTTSQLMRVREASAS